MAENEEPTARTAPELTVEWKGARRIWYDFMPLRVKIGNYRPTARLDLTLPSYLPEGAHCIKVTIEGPDGTYSGEASFEVGHTH